MKIRIFSDVHTEFYQGQVINTLQPMDEDVTVVAGDLAVGWEEVLVALYELEDRGFKNIIYVPGNHEYYKGDMDRFHLRLAGELEGNENITYLNRGIKRIGKVTFIGATLWANFNNEDWATMWHCRRMINDFNLIYKGDQPFTTDTMLNEFHKDWEFIKLMNREIAGTKVIITHFLPTFECVPMRFRAQTLANGYFASGLDDYIEQFEEVPYWIHGHTHDKVDVVIGHTRIVANPVGYPHEKNPFKNLIVELW